MSCKVLDFYQFFQQETACQKCYGRCYGFLDFNPNNQKTKSRFGYFPKRCNCKTTTCRTTSKKRQFILVFTKSVDSNFCAFCNWLQLVEAHDLVYINKFKCKLYKNDEGIKLKKMPRGLGQGAGYFCFIAKSLGAKVYLRFNVEN